MFEDGTEALRDFQEVVGEVVRREFRDLPSLWAEWSRERVAVHQNVYVGLCGAWHKVGAACGACYWWPWSERWAGADAPGGGET